MVALPRAPEAAAETKEEEEIAVVGATVAAFVSAHAKSAFRLAKAPPRLATRMEMPAMPAMQM